MSDIDWDREERTAVWEAIRVIAASPIFQAILTNDASKWMGEDWWDTWEPVRYFDAVIDVASLPFRKPRPGPYLEAIERTGFAPGECVFIDDMPVNCRGAEAIGMHSVWFDVLDPDQSVASLLKLIGYDPGKEQL
jgi:putative hydrolase of the HAD superfamily